MMYVYMTTIVSFTDSKQLEINAAFSTFPSTNDMVSLAKKEPRFYPVFMEKLKTVIMHRPFEYEPTFYKTILRNDYESEIGSVEINVTRFIQN